MYFYRYVAGLREPEIPDDELELDNRIFGNVFHRAAELLYRTLPQYVDKAVLQALLRGQQLERAVGEAFQQEMPYLPQSGLYIIQREVIVQYLRQLVALDIRQAPFRILGLATDAIRELPLPATAGVGGRITVGGRIDRLDFVDEGTARERIRVVDYKTGSRQLKAMADVDAIFQPQNIHDHSDYYLQTLLYADNVRSLQLGTRYGLATDTAVSPALLFIQHAAADDYDPTLCFGRTPILDIAPHSQRFRELLTQTVSDILSPDVDYRPTTDQQVCATCPYHVICQR
jgi:ATP-dependent helicase/DNAse subunit B